jgi:hypothetical protein
MESKFKIKSVKLINSNCYDLDKNIDCTICRCNLNFNSLHSNNKGEDSIIVTGACGHSFHNECIIPWVKNQPNCPICSSQWLSKK